MTSIGLGKSQSYWLKYNSRNSFIRVGAGRQFSVEAGSLVQACPGSPTCVSSPGLEITGRPL